MKTRFFLKNLILISAITFCIHIAIEYFYFNRLSFLQTAISSIVSGTLVSLAFLYANTNKEK